MKRIAAPMIGGMVTSTVLTLLVIPSLYFLWRGHHLTFHEPKSRLFVQEPVASESAK